ncbi:acyltransferase family protein [Sphingomonas sp. TZW2008]|uniref:acyltransferase family protein n=1 Tax=Sphingomonas sp. TZW2008 TaxID=1917973 RepID=UPI0015C4EC2B|nr:acyltransferase family protein [Sphingomonas sp. TZW2008]
MHAATYRRDIDGLRAFAVLPVVAYHLQLRFITGGYVGVDIFFVISGFLITGILAREVEERRFSIGRFYERRIRRIFPAMFFVLAAATIAAFAILYPLELVSYGHSMLWNALFMSNNYFLATTNYFAMGGETKPLIHTWSLAVEEQFYIVFPPLLWVLMRRWGRGVAAVVMAVCAVATLGLSAALLASYPSAVFYLAPLRAWELLIGSLLALDVVPRLRGMAREAGGGLGLLLVVAPVILYTHATPFPGLAALPPCLGTALLIHSGRPDPGAALPTLSARFLAWTPFVWVGLISYSLYLWHWPTIVFYRLGVHSVLGVAEKLALLAVMIALAWFSWRVVERPFRTRALLATRRAIFAGGAFVIAASLATGAALIATDGFASRLSPRVAKLASYLNLDITAQYRQGRCFLSNEEGSTATIDRAACLTPRPGTRNYLLLGDSHGAHLWWGLAHVFPQINVMQATASGCRPLIGAPGLPHCVGERAAVYRLLPSLRPDAVLLAARWRADELPQLVATVRALRGQTGRVIVFGPIVQYDDPLPRLLANAAWSGRTALIAARRRPLDRALDRKLAAAVRGAGGEYISIYDALCRGGDCQTETADGAPLQFDYGHLTPEGSIAIAEHWRRLAAFR